jgi:exoribonuclease II
MKQISSISEPNLTILGVRDPTALISKNEKISKSSLPNVFKNVLPPK